jgi:hypothetical protein
MENIVELFSKISITAVNSGKIYDLDFFIVIISQ